MAKSSSPYHAEYDGYYTMFWHDIETNALKRWFDNYKIEQYASFASETECLIIKEVKFKNRNRYVCEIEDAGRNTKREVIVDHNAPKPPILTFAAKRRYEPPPPKTAAELRKEAEFNRMMMAGYEPVYKRKRPRYRPVTVFFYSDSIIPQMTIDEEEYEIEWVPSRRYLRNYGDYQPAPKPVIPKHRRNV